MLVTGTRVLGSLLLMTLSMLGTGPAMAQGPIQVRIAPRLGIVDPGERLYGVRSTSDGLTSSSLEMHTSPSIGAALLVGSEALGAFLHLSVDHAPSPDSRLVVFGISLDLPVVGRHRSVVPAALTELGADLVLPLRLRLGPFRPFATAGLGFTRYRFSEPELGGPVPPAWVLPVSGTVGGRRFGAGVDVEAWNRGVSLSIVDAVSRYNGETQHHLIVTAQFWFDIRN